MTIDKFLVRWAGLGTAMLLPGGKERHEVIARRPTAKRQRPHPQEPQGADADVDAPMSPLDDEEDMLAQMLSEVLEMEEMGGHENEGVVIDDDAASLFFSDDDAPAPGAGDASDADVPEHGPDVEEVVGFWC